MGYSRTTARADLGRGIETDMSDRGAIAKAILERIADVHDAVDKERSAERSINIGNFAPETVGQKMLRGTIEIIAIPFVVHNAMKQLEHNVKASFLQFIGLDERVPVGDIATMRTIPNDIKEEIQARIDSGELKDSQMVSVTKKYDIEANKAFLDIRLPDGSRMDVSFESKVDRNFDRAYNRFQEKSDNLVSAVGKSESAGERLNQLHDRVETVGLKNLPPEVASDLSKMIKMTMTGELKGQDIHALRKDLMKDTADARQNGTEPPNKLIRQVVSACNDYVNAGKM